MSYWLPKSKRGYAQGITHAFSRLGNAITPALVAMLIAAISWRGSFVVVGVISLFWALAWGLYFRNDPNQHKAITQEEIVALPAYADKKDQVKVPWARLGLRMFPVMVVYFCYGWTLWLFLTLLPFAALVMSGLSLLQGESLRVLREHLATFCVAATTLVAAAILAVVVLHMAAS